MKRYSKITKLLSIFLCLTIFCSAVVAPYAHAAELEELQDQTPDYAVSATSLGGVLTLGSLGSGPIAAGAGAIVSGALPVLMFIITGGLLIYEVSELAKTANELYSLLSSTVREELDNLDLSQPTITLSQNAINELTAVTNDYFYDADGSLAAAGVTLDPSEMLTYNYGAQYLATNETPSTTIYDTPLYHGTVNSIGTTGLLASLVDSPFGDGGLALKVKNPSTGRSVIFQNPAMSKLVNCGSRTYSISPPVIVNNEMGEFGTLHTAGFWVLAHCSNVNCVEHYRYNSYFIGDDNSVSKNNNMLWDGVDVWDSFIFTHQIFDHSVGMWKRVLDTPHDGTSWVYRKNPGMVDVLADVVVDVFRDGTQTFPTSADVLHVPTADVLADVNTLTPDYVKTGVVDGVVPDNPTVDTPVEQTGFWNTLWGWLQRILDAILSLPAKIWQLIQSGFADVVNAVNALKGYLADILEAILGLPQAIRDLFPDQTTDEVDKSILDLIKEFFDGTWDMINNFLDLIGLSTIFSYIGDFFENIGDFFTHDSEEDVNSFFDFMRQLWRVLPGAVTSFVAFAFAMMLLIGVIKIFK